MKLVSNSLRCGGWLIALAVFVAVLVPELALVRAIGTDIPFYDQWNVEGAWLYPAWRDGNLHVVDLLRPVNEHRIAWTHLLNVVLFSLDGQWDPLVQLVVSAVLRAGCVAGLAWRLVVEQSPRRQTVIAVGLALAFLPHLAWHSVIWGFETQVYFALGFSLASLALLGSGERSWKKTMVGIAAGLAGLLAMGPAALVPIALLGWALVRAGERRRLDGAWWRETWPALILLGVVWLGRAPAPEHAQLHPTSVAEFLSAAGRTLGWPHTGSPLAAVVLNAPLAAIIVRRWLGARVTTPTDDFVVLIGGWSAAVALATAWARGGSAELSAGVPSRYVDFLVLLPLSNVWCVLLLAREAVSSRWRRLAPWAAAAWAGFLFVGWIGLSFETMRYIVLPRARDRAAPERLMQQYQVSGDIAIFAGQPRLLIPHPNVAIVRDVLADPRMHGALPPSLQPQEPIGPLSRAARAVLGRQ